MKRKKSFLLNLDEDLYQNLTEKAAENGVSLSQFIRKKLTEKQQNNDNFDEIFAKIDESNALNVELFSNLNAFLERLEQLLKITTFHSVFSAIFMSLKFQSKMNLTEEEWKGLFKKIDNYKEIAGEIIEDFTGENITEDIKNLLDKAKKI